jgi:hypothetical protein
MWAFWLWFVRWGWLYCMIVMSCILTVQLVTQWSRWDTLTKLGAFTVIVLTLHVWEEWVIPGGFHIIYNIHSPWPDRYPMNELTDMITNFGGGLLWFTLTECKHFNSGMGLAVMLFSFFEFAIHNFLAIQSQIIFAAKGQMGFYAPGLVTAVFCWLPLGLAFVIYFYYHHPKWKAWLKGIVILIVASELLVKMPEGLIKQPHNPYSFPNAGYYQKFNRKR